MPRCPPARQRRRERALTRISSLGRDAIRSRSKTNSRVQEGRAVLTYAASLAVWTGAAHVSVSAFRRWLLDDFIWVSADFIWMTPLGYLMIFVALAIPVALVAALAPRLGGDRLGAFVFATLGTLSLLLLFPRLHHLASLALALGVGVRAAAAARARGDEPRRMLGRVAGVLAVLLAVWGGAASGRRAMAGRGAVAERPVAGNAAPNVLLIILDTVRAASMTFHGYARNTTPSLERLAAEGTVFEHAYVTAPWTLPSHAGMFTGHFPSATSTDWQEPFDGRHPTIAQAFRDRGYRTGGFAANHLYTSWESGLARGFDHYEDYLMTPKQVLLSTSLTQTELFWALVKAPSVVDRFRALGRMNLRPLTMWQSDRKLAPVTVDQFLRWQASLGDAPFFAFLNLYDAHLPYDPPTPFDTMFNQGRTPLDRYDGAIAYSDHALGALFDELARRGVLDRTVVVVSSDHGEGFGEHGLSGHGKSLYRTELHVPLLIRYPPRVPGGTRVITAISLRDLPATVLDLAGQHKESGAFPGVSLAKLWGNEAASGSPVVSEVSAGVNTAPDEPVSRGAMASVFDATGHYIRNGDGAEELYAYRTDPGETDDRAKRGEGRDTLPVYRAQLRDALARNPTRRR
jgi:arylsulfatase A-like enzyme